MDTENSSSTRKYDVIIWGATGYTGALVVEHYVAHAPSSIKWAVAGRTRSKLEELCYVKKAKVDVLTANIDDPSSLERLLSQTTVVIACAGPFCKLGTPIVDACIKTGTHYVDITGEYWWIKDLIDKYHDEAKKKKLLIIPACGFDSVPSDLGVYFTVNSAREKLKVDCEKVKNFVAANSGVSSGTIHTLMIAVKDSKILAQGKDVYLLNPPGKQTGNDRIGGPRYDKAEKSWTIPFFMESINARVVRRSAALMDYGRNFSYDELIKTGFIIAILTRVFEPVVIFFLSLGIVQRIISKYVPAGPPKEKLEKGWFTMNFVADTEAKKTLRTQVSWKRDAYVATAVMVGEAALAIATQRDQLYPSGGILTPAVAMGDTLIKRLQVKGMQFNVQDDNQKTKND